jgi:hypothetical protein
MSASYQLVFSPTHGHSTFASEPECADDVPVLRLQQFQQVPCVDFGSVELGASKMTLLRIENITTDVHELRLEKPPSRTLLLLPLLLPWKFPFFSVCL